MFNFQYSLTALQIIKFGKGIGLGSCSLSTKRGGSNATSKFSESRSSECCVLDRLFTLSFGGLSFEGKQQIIIKGRSIPDIC